MDTYYLTENTPQVGAKRQVSGHHFEPGRKTTVWTGARSVGSQRYSDAESVGYRLGNKRAPELNKDFTRVTLAARRTQNASVAQRIERETSNLLVAGSSPAGGTTESLR